MSMKGHSLEKSALRIYNLRSPGANSIDRSGFPVYTKARGEPGDPE